MAERHDMVADCVEAASGRLLDLWLRLGEDGPTGAAAQGRDDGFYRERYLKPLARLFIGALRGSPTHWAIYLDERTRCLPEGLSPEDRRAHLVRSLGIEADAFAAQFTSDRLSPAVLREAFAQLHADLTADRPLDFKLLVVGDCLFVETRAFAQAKARERGLQLDVEHVFFSAKQGAFSVDDVLASVRRRNPDLIGMSLFSFEGVPPYVALRRNAHRMSPGEIDTQVAALVDLLGEAIDRIRELTDAPIAIHSASGLPLTALRRQLPLLSPLSAGERSIVSAITTKIGELAASRENTMVIDEVGLVAAAGGHRAVGRPVFAKADVPSGASHPSRFGEVLADAYLGLVDDVKLLAKAKVLLVDFDHTLWAGVMADGPVQHDLEAQRLLKRLREAGILLVALSKNDPAAIRWSEMALAPDDFVLHKIGWQPKPEGVSQAVAELDLAASAFVLIDDNPAERALVTEQVPGVKALDSLRPETWKTLARWLSMPSTKSTEEARRRTELYREAAERRRTLSGLHDYPAMMRSLDLRLGFRPAEARDMDRLLELTQRTNQFNTTTKRRSAAEIRNLLASDAHQIYVASLADRFGSLGVVATAIVERRPEREIVFDSVIMSCRAMGFGLEQALVRKVIDQEPADTYVGLFEPTPRNSPAAGLFPSSGFSATEASHWILQDPAAVPPVPGWFQDAT